MKKLTILFVLLALAAGLFFQYCGKGSGMDRVLLASKDDPTISFRILFYAGSQNDPKGKEGLAALTAAMMTEGATQKNSYEQVLDKLYPLAAGYSANTSMEATVITGRTHKDNLKEYYPLLIDAVTAPAFKEEDLKRLKSDALNYLENVLRYASDEELGKAVLYNSIFAGTGYGHITAGMVQSVAGITIDDVKNFYKQYYTKENAVIGVGGGFSQSIVDDLERDLGALSPGKRVTAEKPAAAKINGLQVTMVDKDAPATAISIGFPIDLLRGSKEWYALAIATSWLGEHRNSSSHLYQVIREQRGLNYGDYAYIENFPNGGRYQMPPQNAGRRQQIFEIWIRPVPNETRHFALRAALREFKSLVDNGMSEDDFTLTRKFLKNYVLHFAPTTMERLGYAVDDYFYGINGSHLQKYREMMSTITREDVNAAIKKYWQYQNLKIAIVTKDAAQFKEALVKDLPSPITYKTPKPESVLNDDKAISAFPVKIPAENISIVKVGELFEK